MDSDGNIYGTTAESICSIEEGPCTCPVVFKLTPTGQYSILHQFRQNYTFTPFTTGYSGNLAVGADGWLYGTVPIANNPNVSGYLYAVQYKAMPSATKPAGK